MLWSGKEISCAGWMVVRNVTLDGRGTAGNRR